MKRQAFGMIFAIILTVLVATLGVLGLRLSTSTLNTTTNEHIAIQLDLYLRSTAELAILYVQRYGFEKDENGAARANPMLPITKTFEYGDTYKYKFNCKMTPLFVANNADHLTNAGQQAETMKNTMVLDISGEVTNPVTKQVFRVTRRQIVKP